jgi:hypothetical protein
MNKLHDVQSITFSQTKMHLRVDGKEYEIEMSRTSKRLAMATQSERENFEVSQSGYGIHWPDIDEDLSIDGLIGVKRSYHLVPKHVS